MENIKEFFLKTIQEIQNNIIMDIAITILMVTFKHIFTRIKFFEFFKCSTIDYTILKRKEKRFNTKYIYIKLFSNLIMVILYVVIYLIVVELSIVFLKIKFNYITEKNGIIIIGMVIGLVFLVSFFISRLDNYNKIKWYGLATIESFLLLFFISYFLEKKETFIIFVFCYSIILCIMVTMLLDSYILKKIHIKHKRIIFTIIAIRYISFIILISTLVFLTKLFNVFYVIWSGIICIENMFVLFDDVNYYDFKIHIKEKIIEVNNSIAQCYNSQVVYKTKDGLLNFIECENIKFISYEIKKKEKKKVKNRVVCIFTNGEKDYYSDYKINKKDWVMLKKDLGNVYKIYIYNSKYLKCIGIEKEDNLA